MLPSLMHSFVGQSSIRELCPPALLLLEGERTEGRKKRKKFYTYSDVTHTQTDRQTEIHAWIIMDACKQCAMHALIHRDAYTDICT
jgi:hypothetical protein